MMINSRVKKGILVFLIIILMILITVLIFSSQKKTSPKSPSLTSENKKSVTDLDVREKKTVLISPTSVFLIKLKGREIASKTRKFIESLKTGVGDYITSLVCVADSNKKGSCQSTEVKSYIPGMVVSMYEDFYQKTGDFQDKEEADRLMDELMSRCESDTSFCEMMFFPLFSYYKKTNNPRYLNAMKRVGDEIFVPVSLNEAIKEPVNTFVLRIKKLLMIYSASGDDIYLRKAQERMARLDEVRLKDETNELIYQQFGVGDLRKYDCQIYWSAHYQFYQSTGVQNYLTIIKKFVDKIDLENNYQKINEIVPLVSCSELLLALYNETAEKEYFDNARLLLNHAVNNFYDSDLKPKFNGDNGFVFKNYSAPLGDKANNKTLTENIWMVRHLIRFGWDEEFEF